MSNDIKLTTADANSLARGAPRLPAIPSSFGTDPKTLISAIKEIIEVREGQRGSPLDKSLTWRDLFNQGVIALNIDGQAHFNPPSGGVVPAPANNGSIDQTPPPAATGLMALGALASIIVQWDLPQYGNNAHSHTEVWASGTNDFSTAQLIGTSPSQFYVDVTGAGAVRFYWIRWVSKFPVAGPFNKTDGTRGETGYDASYLIDVLKANPPPGVNYNPLLWVNADPNLVVNGVPVPLGTYMQAAYIADGTISRAKIGLAAIDDARIANLSAAKITAGDISADRMRANIVQAVMGQFVSLSAVSANLGTVTINQFGYLRTENAVSYGVGTGLWMGWDGDAYRFRVGTPGGQGLFWDGGQLWITGNINSTGDGNFRGSLNTGAFTGYGWPANGGQGVHIGPGGALMGNPSGPGHFQYEASSGRFTLAGTGGISIWTPNFAVDYAGNVRMAGNLTGSNGRFDGTLRAGIVDTDQLIDRSVTSPIFWQLNWPGGYGNGTIDTFTYGNFQFNVPTNSFVMMYGETVYGALWFQFDLVTSPSGGNAGALANVGDGRVLNRVLGGASAGTDGNYYTFNPEANYTYKTMIYLPAGTYWIDGYCNTDGNSNSGGAGLRMVFFKR